MWSGLLRRLASGLWTTLKLASIAGIVALGSCSTASVVLRTAPDTLPDSFSPATTPTLPRPQALALLESEIYGPVLVPSVRVLDFATLDDAALDGSAVLQQWRLELDYGGEPRPLDIVLLMPKGRPDAPVIVSQNFCPNSAVIPLPNVAAPGDTTFCDGGGLLGWVMTGVFGRHIVTPPIETIIARGYGFAAMYPSQAVPDAARLGDTVLDDMYPEDDRPGALASWAGLFAVAAQQIELEHGPRPVVAYGHSRFGKTSLLAGAYLDAVDAVIAHQSGTLGASRLTDETGEPLDALVGNYPHWGNKRLRTYAETPSALPVGPEDLLAAIAPKPVLLGNAKRDTWSDPLGAFASAQAAWGSRFATAQPGEFRPGDAVAFWQRPGTHGVVKEDWEAFLRWLDARSFD